MRHRPKPRLFCSPALLAAGCLLAATAEAVEPLGFKRHATPSAVLLGEPFTYQLVITHPKDHRYELRPVGDLGAFELLDHRRSRIDGKQSATTTFQLRLALFELGKKELPAVTFDVATPEGASEWTATGITVDGKQSLPPEAERGEALYDIHPPEEVPVRTWRLFYVLGAILAAALLGYAAYRWLNRPRPAVAVPVKPLHERTLTALDSLCAEQLPQKGKFREFHFRLSEILRGYLGERYEIDALESTSSELMEELRRLHTPGLPSEELARFCLESDLVKYARASATADQCRASLEFGYRLVHLTPPLAPAPAAYGHASPARAS
ncbi:MAG: hypothetical protein HYZ28_20935 [Myxococcales bacterium]|nr:hypothetical protein [Myxococcales bacterium]